MTTIKQESQTKYRSIFCWVLATRGIRCLFDVSYERSASIFRVTEFGSGVCFGIGRIILRGVGTP